MHLYSVCFCVLSGIYLTLVMALTSLSIIMAVFVLNLHHRGPYDKPLPNWLKKMCLGKSKKLARGLCFSRADRHYVNENTNLVPSAPFRLKVESLAQELTDEFDNSYTTEIGTEVPNTHFGTRYHPPGYVEVNQTDHSQAKRPQHFENLGNSRHKCFKTNEDILGALEKIIDRYEEDDNIEDRIYEWRQVAVAVDRILFWIFFFVTTASTVIVLIVIPATRFI